MAMDLIARYRLGVCSLDTDTEGMDKRMDRQGGWGWGEGCSSELGSRPSRIFGEIYGSVTVYEVDMMEEGARPEDLEEVRWKEVELGVEGIGEIGGRCLRTTSQGWGYKGGAVENVLW